MTLRQPGTFNPLGDIRAEADRLLDGAFLETPDYSMLLAGSERFIVVGRRGTGKSALFLALTKYWSTDRHATVMRWSPEEEQVLGLKPIFRRFGPAFTTMRAACRLSAEFAILHELLNLLATDYKLTTSAALEVLRPRLSHWMRLGDDPTERLRKHLGALLPPDSDPEQQVSQLPYLLDIQPLREALRDALPHASHRLIILVDRLDEGYQSDTVGTAIVDGIIHAMSAIKTRHDSVKPVLFLRDNIFRAIETDDPDFSRTIEGQYIRLHWDESQLLRLIAKRLRKAFSLSIDNDVRLWNHCVAPSLAGEEGFRQCLRLTLYRPRDLISLLNSSFGIAASHGRPSLELEDIEAAAREISSHRLDDLVKEYLPIIPGLPLMVQSFSGREPPMTMESAYNVMSTMRESSPLDSVLQRELAIFGDPDTLVRVLYSIGFLGVKDGVSGRFVFCHDGRSPDRAFQPKDEVLVHPCYWIALNMNRNALEKDAAADIYDEYSIEVSSEATDIRRRNLGQLIAKLDAVPTGHDGSTEFEEWVAKAIRVLFAAHLQNIELRANKSAALRRDVLATNASSSGVWQRVLTDYHSRQVVFEVKNYEHIEAEDYHQVNAYLGREYGLIGFIVGRVPDEDLKRERGHLELMRELYMNQGHLIVLLSARSLRNLLSKLRSPQRTDVADRYLSNVLDKYTRLFLAGRT